MNEPLTIKATVAVWFTNPDSAYMRNELERAIEQQDAQQIINSLSFYGPPGHEMKGLPHWLPMGEADITLRLISQDERTRAAVNALHDKLDELRAAYLTKQREILAEISKYEALEMAKVEA